METPIYAADNFTGVIFDHVLPYLWEHDLDNFKGTSFLKKQEQLYSFFFRGQIPPFLS